MIPQKTKLLKIGKTYQVSAYKEELYHFFYRSGKIHNHPTKGFSGKHDDAYLVIESKSISKKDLAFVNGNSFSLVCNIICRSLDPHLHFQALEMSTMPNPTIQGFVLLHQSGQLTWVSKYDAIHFVKVPEPYVGESREQMQNKSEKSL